MGYDTTFSTIKRTSCCRTRDAIGGFVSTHGKPDLDVAIGGFVSTHGKPDLDVASLKTPLAIIT